MTDHFEARVQSAVKESQRLDPEAGYRIECDRCNDWQFSDDIDANDAQQFFHSLGWRMGDDRYQLCPRCSGDGG